MRLRSFCAKIRCQHFSFSRSEPCPAAHDEPLPAAVAFYVRGEATRRLAEVLRSRRAERGGGLTSEGQRPERAEVLFFPAMRGFDVHDVQEPPPTRKASRALMRASGSTPPTAYSPSCGTPNPASQRAL